MSDSVTQNQQFDLDESGPHTRPLPEIKQPRSRGGLDGSGFVHSCQQTSSLLINTDFTQLSDKILSQRVDSGQSKKMQKQQDFGQSKQKKIKKGQHNAKPKQASIKNNFIKDYIIPLLLSLACQFQLPNKIPNATKRGIINKLDSLGHQLGQAKRKFFSYGISLIDQKLSLLTVNDGVLKKEWMKIRNLFDQFRRPSGNHKEQLRKIMFAYPRTRQKVVRSNKMAQRKICLKKKKKT